MILFGLLKESVKQIDKFYGKTLLRSTLADGYFYYNLDSKSYQYRYISLYPSDRTIQLFQNSKDQITIDFDDILSNDLEYLVLVYGKILLEVI